MTKRVLGRGLEALLSAHDGETGASAIVDEIPVDQIIPNDAQPRRRFDPDQIADLAKSIESKGIIQPILVRPVGERFQIIAGERRLLAAKQAGLRRVPVIKREVPDDEMLQWALIENLQRADLDPVEEAEAFRVLVEDKGLTHEDLSVLVGRDRSSITNAIRLLRLSEPILAALAESRITAGHGRALLQLPEGPARDKLFRKILRGGLSVRKAEELARGPRPSRRQKEAAVPHHRDPELSALEEKLRLCLGTRVRIRPSGKGGVIEIEYYSAEELERVFAEIVAGEGEGDR